MKTVIFSLLLFSISFHICRSQIKVDPKDTEVWEPVPPVITPVKNGMPPSDAIILFNGNNLYEWESSQRGRVKWKLENGILTVVPKTGNISTRRSFGDCQLHIEWRTPVEIEGEGQGRGNSGIFFMERYEIQILDSYKNITYPNGQAGSVYKQHIPLVNACHPPGEWQSYDIIFTAPVFDDEGNLTSPGWFTVFHNGVLIHNNVEIKGATVFIGEPEYTAHPDKLPVKLQDHGNPVSFRNIWIREL